MGFLLLGLYDERVLSRQKHHRFLSFLISLLLQLIEVLLSVRPGLGATPRPYVLVDLVPVLAVHPQRVNKAVVLLVGPLARIEDSITIAVIAFYRPIFYRAVLAALFPRIFRIPFVTSLQGS